MKLPCAVKKSLPKEVDMLVDEVARPQEISLASGTRLKSTAERRS
jgi:hypothetical protein